MTILGVEFPGDFGSSETLHFMPSPLVDPFTSLAFSVFSHKGAYALLLGSGVSRGAGVPTGWEITLDLIHKVAALEKADPGADPVKWWKDRTGGEPDYSKLLDAIAPSSAERQRLLRGYFEPTEQERTEKLKVPGPAHHAIARLAADGYFRVIITTNFDRLIETALEAAGVVPTVITTADQVAGALPLAHSGVTVLKLHGDYLDTRIKNTEKELSAYPRPLVKWLDRIFDEFGLIVAGWSGEWDHALRAAIERSPSRRFTMFWACRTGLGAKAKPLAEQRAARVIDGTDANAFFVRLQENVASLADLSAPHPLSDRMAAATVKRLLVTPEARIRLHDLVHRETESVASQVTSQAFPASTTQQHSAEMVGRLKRYEGICQTLEAIVSVGTYWGDAEQAKLWCRSIQRVANVPNDHNGLEYLINLRGYPALRLLYASGVAAVAAAKYSTLRTLFEQIVVRDLNGRASPIVLVLTTHDVMRNNAGHLIPGLERNYTPCSDHLFQTLREPLREFLPDDREYQTAFDRFELLRATEWANRKREEHGEGWRTPYGCFAWRGRLREGSLVADAIQEIEREGKEWPPIQAGLLGGSLDEAKLALMKVDRYIGALGLM